ncbi:3549_t:CDS:2 [Cetraspora pellucida]|uniref:3549_t:CDS:1 n=1 Tax=Cetraspora pellucida TaxID=1433469 RepID=A0ACA9KX24_9GLOM|nr:3549_t:CDS:2 [Cetraspora pellucida]
MTDLQNKKADITYAQLFQAAPNIRKEALKVLRPRRVTKGKLAEFCLNKNDDSYITSMYCNAQVNSRPVILILDSGSSGCVVSAGFLKDAGITIDRPSTVMMTGVHGEQKRPLGEIDEFPVTVGGKTITSRSVVTDARNYMPANIGDRIVRAGTNEERKKGDGGSDTESNEDYNDDDKSSEEDKFKEEDKYVEEKGLISQTYLYFKFYPMRKETDIACGLCLRRGHFEMDCLWNEYKDVFAHEPNQLGRTSVVQHEIHTEEGPPDRIEFLGYEISGEGIAAAESKVSAIKNFPQPKNVRALRGFLGLAGFYRRFIKDFAGLVASLYKLLKLGEDYEWKIEQQAAFDELKQRLTMSPVLAHPQDNKNYILYTDASHLALGAVLCQPENDGFERVVEYASRSTKPAEKNYTITELECTAIMWAIKKFYQYLHGTQFVIVTNHTALTYLNNMLNPTGRIARILKRDEVRMVLEALHDDPTSGHLGEGATIEKARSRYHWNQMIEDIKSYIRSCDACQRHGRPKIQEALHPIQVTQPFDRVEMDIVGPLPLIRNAESVATFVLEDIVG